MTKDQISKLIDDRLQGHVTKEEFYDTLEKLDEALNAAFNEKNSDNQPTYFIESTTTTGAPAPHGAISTT